MMDANVLNLIKPMQMTSDMAYAFFKKEGMRFKYIFIDGDHSYKQCLKDIQNFKELLTNDGVIAGDDYNGGGGVKQAVIEVFGDSFTFLGDPLYPAWIKH